MSSSDRLERPRLVNLEREKPQSRRDEFNPRSQFERVSSASGAPMSADEAYQNGLVDGEQRGREAALKELVPVLDELRALGRALASARHERIEQAQRELTDVAVEIARRILHGELSSGGDVVVRMARACIDEAKEVEGILTLHVAPGDIDLIRTHLPELEADLADATLRVVAEPALPQGHVLLETSRRCYEGRPDRLLDAAADAARIKGQRS